MESQLLVNYAQTLTGEHVGPVKMGEFLDGYLEREHKRLEAVSLSSLFSFISLMVVFSISSL